MSGSSRNARKRRQARAAAGEPRPVPPVAPPPLWHKRGMVGLIVAAVLVALTVGVYLTLSRAAEPPLPAASYPVAVDGVVVRAGQAGAPVTIDVYEDFLCPFCERLESNSGPELTTALNEGKVKVNYHGLDILANRSDPPGYSTLAANAALCAVPAGIWPAYHQRLFAEQPAEGGAGLTAAELTTIGTDLGAGPEFGACVQGNAQAAAISAASEAAVANPALQTDGRFGTPTVMVGGRKIDVSGSDWLQTVLAGR